MRLPRPIVLTAAVVLVAGATISLLGAWRTGISWDESYHVMRLRNLLEHGWYLLDQDLDGDRPGDWESQKYVYGPVAALLLHAWTVLWGGESWGAVSASSHAYALRHVGVALIGLVGVGATAGVTRALTRRWDQALLAAAVLVSVPTWTGHSMFNVKDVPVATGYTLVTLGCVLLLSPRLRNRRGLAALPLLAGLVLAIGTRPGIWPGVGLACFVTVLVLVMRREWWPAALALVTGVAAYGLLVVAYPNVFDNPVATLLHSVGESSDFGDKPGQWWYLPVFLAVELPTLWLVAGAVGAVIAVRRWRSPGLVIVLAQTFALPVLAIAHRSNIYTGIRQFLFAAPGLAVLVTLAVVALLEGRRRRWATWLVGAALVAPMIGEGMLFPYVYAFESAPANLAVPVLAKHDKALEVQTDYWRTSVRELAPSVPKDAFVTCSPELRDDIFWRHSSETSDDCSHVLISPLAAYDDRRVLTWGGSATEFVAVRQGNGTIASNCTELDSISRRLWWRKLTMSTVSRCELHLPDYAGPITFTGSGAGAGYLLGGWWLHPKNDFDGLAPGESGELGFMAPHPGALTLAVDATGSPSLTVNGTAVALDASGHAAVPAAIAEAWQGRVVVRVTAAADDVRFFHLSVR
ncbi:hypothetical protein [Nocardioides sp. Kera G14]|uniref:hypothetical protein n=1 Tax=Nocardioides sp. Kera G14 TaxID=2884264 RepID=UPI001D10ED61|nr:hypothetical protein [Nocardioides sp. Kera G14]UDY24800.1 hypothetical protein LH076_05740 [Nocardioides sp. Kera G14]